MAAAVGQVLRYAGLAFRPAPVVLVATFTVLLIIASGARFAGIPLALITASWFSKYCFVLFDAAVAGGEPPVLSVEMLNPISELRPLMALVLMGLLYALLFWLRSEFGTPAFIAGSVVMWLILPAMIGVVGVTGNALHAISPRALHALVRGVGVDYAWIVLGPPLVAVIAERLASMVPLGVSLVLNQFVYLIFFAVLGGLIHENRIGLGFTTLTRREREMERQDREHSKARDHMLERAYHLVQLRRTGEGWAEIERWIVEHCAGEAAWKEWSSLLSATARWDNPAIADRVVNTYLGRLMEAGETGKAVELVERRHLDNPDFLPQPPALAVRIAELAGLAGKRSLQRRLAERQAK